MAAQELVVPDLQSDNFDLLRFPSLTGFPSLIESDDLNMMARMGSLFDAKQPATANSPKSANGDGLQHHQQHQMQQHMRHTPPPMQQLLSRPQQAMLFSPNSPGYPMLSPRSAAPEASPAYLPPQPAVMVRATMCFVRLSSVCWSISDPCYRLGSPSSDPSCQHGCDCQIVSALPDTASTHVKHI